MHKFMITRKPNEQTGLRHDNYVTIRKNQFTSREVVIQINKSCVISLRGVIRDPSPMFSSLIVRVCDMRIPRQ
jgi:hypothetical protein